MTHHHTDTYISGKSGIYTGVVMILLTDRASAKVREFMRKEGKKSAYLRVRIAGGGCSGFTYDLGLEEKKGKDDTVVTCDGVEMLVDPESAPYLDGAVIDYYESFAGSGFRVENPNATSTCGCGQSFEV